MAEIRNYLFLRHFRTEPSLHVVRYRAGKPVRSGRGLAFWFTPLSASIAEVPVDDCELDFMFQTRSADFQDVTVQGVVTYRVTDPVRLAERVDFTIDLDSGRYTKEPREQLASMLTQLAQQLTASYVTGTEVRPILTEGIRRIRTEVEAGLRADAGLADAGLEVVSVRIASVRPTAAVEKALEMPIREKIQQRADEATFERRALAVENERAIAENELKNQIELARREKQLIDQRGANELNRVEQEAQANRVEAEAAAERNRIQASGKAEGLRLVEKVKAEAERERMDVYRDLPQSVMIGLAARELAGKLHTIEHLNLTPDLLGPLLTNLVEAGTARLEE